MPKTIHLHIRLTPEEAALLLTALEKANKDQSFTKSSLILWLIKRYLKEKDK